MKKELKDGRRVFIVGFDPLNDFARETAYKVKHLIGSEQINLNLVFHPKDDREWFEKELTQSILGVSGYLPILKSVEGNTLILEDYERSTDAEVQGLQMVLDQMVLWDLCRKWYDDKLKHSYQEQIAALLPRLEELMIRFQLRKKNIQKYPAEDQEYWGDDYDLKRKQ
jgi:hypothetical protein